MLKKLNDKSEFYTVANPKLNISKAISGAMNEKDLSMRELAKKIGNISHPQIHRITSGENYNIDTLLRVLDGLDLEIVVQKK